ncbi:hypothetical protein ABID96_002066 [Bacillus sp. OAE603]
MRSGVTFEGNEHRNQAKQRSMRTSGRQSETLVNLQGFLVYLSLLSFKRSETGHQLCPSVASKESDSFGPIDPDS